MLHSNECIKKTVTFMHNLFTGRYFYYASYQTVTCTYTYWYFRKYMHLCDDVMHIRIVVHQGTSMLQLYLSLVSSKLTLQHSNIYWVAVFASCGAG